MKIFTAKAKRGKLKYHEEHIKYTLEDTDAYNWRKIQNQITSCTDLSLSPELEFITSKINFKNLDKIHWLKSEFRIPILSNKFIRILKEFNDVKFQEFPIIIKDSKNDSNVNHNFSGVYIDNYFNCIDTELSESISYSEKTQYDYRTCKFKSDLSYPTLFKIKNASTPFMHFVNEQGMDKLSKYGITDIDFELISK